MIKMLIKNKLTIITAIAILYLSLASSSTFDEVDVFDFPYIDKVVHFCMYFGLMLTLQIENTIYTKKLRSLILLALIPMFYGIVMEICQSWLTETRFGDFVDALFDFFGILVAAGIWQLYLRFMNKSAGSAGIK
jgi:VanZ family protein